MKINATTTAVLKEKSGICVLLSNVTSIQHSGVTVIFFEISYGDDINNYTTFYYKTKPEARAAYRHLMDRLGFKLD